MSDKPNKRLVFCFDGTWNRLDAPHPTNVVLIAQALKPQADDGTVQIIHYDEGVGTAKEEKWGGGLFGHGLLTNMVEAYKFLIFNYEIGDEIYVFGFSRGAFTARSFVGLVEYAGIPRRRDAARITEAIRHYENRPKDSDPLEALRQFRLECSPDLCVDASEDEWRASRDPLYTPGRAPILRIRYVGVWDTVGSLGVPASLPWAKWSNRKYQFHRSGLSSVVVSARHAVAVDERRNSFAPTLWDNLDDLNGSLGFELDDPNAPYQQRWFPGDHGSVGGGGQDRRLSDEALDWVLRGARRMGLEVDTSETSPLFELQPDYAAPLNNMLSKPKFNPASWGMSRLPARDRSPGPARLSELSESTVARWRAPLDRLPGGQAWRPPTLNRVAPQLDGTAEPVRVRTSVPLAATGPVHTVQRGDSLRGIALALGQPAAFAQVIFEANRAVLTDPDRIYPGQKLWIPQSLPSPDTA